jgi:hypothetical protein
MSSCTECWKRFTLAGNDFSTSFLTLRMIKGSSCLCNLEYPRCAAFSWSFSNSSHEANLTKIKNYYGVRGAEF